jgi:hypothetical protein
MTMTTGSARQRGFAAALVLSAAAAAVTGCHNAPCREPGFDEGERFQITVLAPLTGPCTFAPLAAGDTFVLTGGAAQTDAASCPVRGASPEVPAFATAVLTSCRESLTQLGLECMGTAPVSCAVSAQLRLSPLVQRGVDTIPHGVFTVVWSTNGCNGGGCRDDYDVRIDRLAAAP